MYSVNRITLKYDVIYVYKIKQGQRPSKSKPLQYLNYNRIGGVSRVYRLRLYWKSRQRNVCYRAGSVRS